MNISFIIKASADIGYGHLIRSREVANVIHELKHKNDRIIYYVIGDKTLDNLLSNVEFDYRIFESEVALVSQIGDSLIDDIVIFDLNSIGDELLDSIKASECVVSLCPIFNHMDKVDILFHRTQYHNYSFNEKTKVYKGFEYVVIQKGCKKINTALFKQHAYEDKMSIAVSMGGTDAANKTLETIRQINKLKDDYIVWIMIGEGYKHSYDNLIEESKKSHHEVILAKTNSSMWKVLSFSSLLISPGGITIYEAAYAGLPTINFFEKSTERFLVQELLENNICDEVDSLDSGELVEKIEYYNNNRDKLFAMHLNSKGIVDGWGAKRIYEIISKRCR